MDENKTPAHVWLALVAIVLSLLTIGFTIGSMVTRTSAVEPEVVQTVASPVVTRDSGRLPGDDKPATESAVLEGPLPEIVNLGEFKITHYCPCPKCCGEWADGVTYTGTQATEGRTIAVDPDVIPLGSIVEIGGQEYIAEDVGGAIQGNRIDVYMASHQAALEAGVKYAEVFIYE